VLVVKIAASDTKPHYALDEQKKWWVYYRVNDKSILASKIIVDVIKKSNDGTANVIRYTDQEQKLFEFLTKEGRITLKQFSKLTRSSYRQAQTVIVSLILGGVIKPVTSEKEEYYVAI
jgi:predicted HTH transcriptional regulator